jgi:hypothetical protein
MKKYLASLFFACLANVAIFAQTNIDVKVVVAPVGANITMNSYVWDIAFTNDGATSYQNDRQGIMTVKSGSSRNFHVYFSSDNLGYIKQGAYQIPYYVKVTQLTTGNLGIVGSPSIMAGYVQLTSTQSIQFNRKTPQSGNQFYVGIKINAISGAFFESGAYTDNLIINFVAP